MIQGDVLVCGTINATASEKTNKTGGTFITFPVLVPLQGRDDSVCEVIVHVSAPGDKKTALKFAGGKFVQAQGRLTVRIKDGTVYYNVRCDSEPVLASLKEGHKIEGTLDFSGCISKDGLITKQDSKGRDYKIFQAFSSDKHKDDNGVEKKEYIWVHFIYFHPKDEPFLTAKKYIDAYGDLDMNVHNSKLQIQCRLKTVKEHFFDGGKAAETGGK